ncbi:MAG: phosphoribosylanthranilate isomerase [Bacteroidota bacterium]|nr:phosphoribosylanthranilate isomerase [Bacteroidota bacterium]
MNAPFIKICGITRFEDALAAFESGASAIGFNFYSGSKRHISPQDAAKVSGKLPDTITRVGVFVNAQRGEIEAVRKEVALDVLQFHGDEMPEELSGYDIPVVKAIHIAKANQLESQMSYAVDAFLLDSFSPKEFGGTGKTFDWNIALEAKQRGKIILSGGLTPANVEEAIIFVQPFGVDVSSGVERSPGIKDHRKIQEFIAGARRGFDIANNQLASASQAQRAQR